MLPRSSLETEDNSHLTRDSIHRLSAHWPNEMSVVIWRRFIRLSATANVCFVQLRPESSGNRQTTGPEGAFFSRWKL